MSSTTLQHKHAIVFGGGGSIGAAVAKELASAGGEVFVAGRTTGSVEATAAQIAAAGGRAHAALVDTLDAAAVDAFVDSVVERAGSLDVALNATGPRIGEYGNGKPLVDLSSDEFLVAINAVLRSNFNTARATARQMSKQGAGVIIFLTGSPARPHEPGTSAIGAAFGALENLTRTRAIDLGPAGVRVVCVRTAANWDSRTIQETAGAVSELANITKEQMIQSLAQATMLKVSPTTADTARAAAFLASDQARMLTGTVLNASAGACAD
jgi:NAD(P)-dependent dehydrogenase (short-subunit alcohol dehydrogenase family)